jgi:hypothetical protein
MVKKVFKVEVVVPMLVIFSLNFSVVVVVVVVVLDHKKVKI